MLFPHYLVLPHLLLLFPLLCYVWRQDSIDLTSVQSLLRGEFQRQPLQVLPLWSKAPGEWPAPIQGWCVLVNIGVSWEHSTILSTPKLQSLLFWRSAFKTWSKHVLQQCHLLTPENILSSGHTLISKAISGAIIWADTVPVTENPLMMMNSGYWWLQSDPQWWVGDKTLAFELCELLSVNRSGFRKSSSKI